MNITNFKKFFQGLFDNEVLEFCKETDQYGFSYVAKSNYYKLGYATNITPEVIERAHQMEVDFLLTHHHVWENMFEMRDDCLAKLEQYGITHFYNHLPLDDSDFGTNASLIERLGLKETVKINQYEMMHFGRVGEYSKPITLKEFVDNLEKLLGEPVYVWKNNDKLVKRVAVCTGSGAETEVINEANELRCDVYISGESKSKAIIYSEHIGMNFIVGSHTYTEFFGVQSFAKKIIEAFPEVEMVRIPESHHETTKRWR